MAGKVPKKLKRRSDKPEEALGAAMTEVRLARGLSSETVSHVVGCTLGYLNEMENGKRNPSYKVLRAIAEVLKIKLSLLISRAERKYESSRKKKD